MTSRSKPIRRLHPGDQQSGAQRGASRLRERQGGQVRLSAERLPGDRVQIRCEDNGVGIAAEHLNWVFEPFFTTAGPGRQRPGAVDQLQHRAVAVRRRDVRQQRAGTRHHVRAAAAAGGSADARGGLPAGPSHPAAGLPLRGGRQGDGPALGLRALECRRVGARGLVLEGCSSTGSRMSMAHGPGMAALPRNGQTNGPVLEQATGASLCQSVTGTRRC